MKRPCPRLWLLAGTLALSACGAPMAPGAPADKLVPCPGVTVEPGKHFHVRLVIQRLDPGAGTFHPVRIPADVGIESLGDGRKCYREVHTHHEDNWLHVEPSEKNPPHTLVQFLTIWKDGAALFDGEKHAVSIMAYSPLSEKRKRGKWQRLPGPSGLFFEDKMEVVITIVPLKVKSP